MRELIRKFWNKVKWPLFLIIWTAGTIGWMYFYQEFKITRVEANWTYQEVQKLQEQKVENKTKDVGGEVEESTSMQDTPNEGVAKKPKNFSPSSGIEKLIYKYFKDDYQTAKAVFTAESQLNETAQGWNCRYGKISRACEETDRAKAWSVDCGIAQINVAGTVCPQELFNADNNLQVARNKYEARKWQPWSAFTSKSYLAFM